MTQSLLILLSSHSLGMLDFSSLPAMRGSFLPLLRSPGIPATCSRSRHQDTIAQATKQQVRRKQRTTSSSSWSPHPQRTDPEEVTPPILTGQPGYSYSPRLSPTTGSAYPIVNSVR